MQAQGLRALYLESKHQKPHAEWRAWAKAHKARVCRCASFEYADVVLHRLRPTIVVCTGILTVRSERNGADFARALLATLRNSAKLLIVHEMADADFLCATRGEAGITVMYSSDAALAQDLAVRWDCGVISEDLDEAPGLFPLNRSPLFKDTADERCSYALGALHRLWSRGAKEILT